MSAAGAAAFAVCFVALVVMGGIYMIRRLDIGLVKAKKEAKEALADNQRLRDDIRSLRAELQLERNKIHDADAT